MKTLTILKQGKYWWAYSTGFEFDTYLSPTPFRISIPAERVIAKLAALAANSDVEQFRIMSENEGTI